jgi:hypothetical protein
MSTRPLNLTGRPQSSQRPVFATNWGVGGGYEISNISEDKTRSSFGLERIKIRENAPQAISSSIVKPAQLSLARAFSPTRPGPASNCQSSPRGALGKMTTDGSETLERVDNIVNMLDEICDHMEGFSSTEEAWLSRTSLKHCALGAM